MLHERRPLQYFGRENIYCGQPYGYKASRKLTACHHQEKTLPNHVISDLHAPRCFGDFASQVFKAFTTLSKQTVPAAAMGAASQSVSSAALPLPTTPAGEGSWTAAENQCLEVISQHSLIPAYPSNECHLPEALLIKDYSTCKASIFRYLHIINIKEKSGNDCKNPLRKLGGLTFRLNLLTLNGYLYPILCNFQAF